MFSAAVCLYGVQQMNVQARRIFY